MGYDLDEHNILVFDLGGGSFDASIMRICVEDGIFEVLSTAGNTHLGGEDFDNVLVQYFVSEIQRKKKGLGPKLRANKRAMRRLRTQCERAKRTLSVALCANIEVDNLIDGMNFAARISRAQFEGLCLQYFQQCMELVTTALTDAKLSKSDIADVVLVGGSTDIPKVQKLLEQYFNRKERIYKWLFPETAVVTGAAIQSALLSGEDMGDLDMLVMDVTPLSIAIETAGGVMKKVMPRGTTVPRKKTELITRGTEQTDTGIGMNVKIFEGDQLKTADNNLLGTFHFQDISHTPQCVPQIELSFNVDLNGILSVVGKETRDHWQSYSITLASNGGIRPNEEELNQIQCEAIFSTCMVQYPAEISKIMMQYIGDFKPVLELEPDNDTTSAEQEALLGYICLEVD